MRVGQFGTGRNDKLGSNCLVPVGIHVAVDVVARKHLVCLLSLANRDILDRVRTGSTACGNRLEFKGEFIRLAGFDRRNRIQIGIRSATLQVQHLATRSQTRVDDLTGALAIGLEARRRTLEVAVDKHIAIRRQRRLRSRGARGGRAARRAAARRTARGGRAARRTARRRRDHITVLVHHRRFVFDKRIVEIAAEHRHLGDDDFVKHHFGIGVATNSRHDHRRIARNLAGLKLRGDLVPAAGRRIAVLLKSDQRLGHAAVDGRNLHRARGICRVVRLDVVVQLIKRIRIQRHVLTQLRTGTRRIQRCRLAKPTGCSSGFAGDRPVVQTLRKIRVFERNNFAVRLIGGDVVRALQRHIINSRHATGHFKRHSQRRDIRSRAEREDHALHLTVFGDRRQFDRYVAGRRHRFGAHLQHRRVKRRTAGQSDVKFDGIIRIGRRLVRVTFQQRTFAAEAEFRLFVCGCYVTGCVPAVQTGAEITVDDQFLCVCRRENPERQAGNQHNQRHRDRRRTATAVHATHLRRQPFCHILHPLLHNRSPFLCCRVWQIMFA